jgi:hypothetical protein
VPPPDRRGPVPAVGAGAEIGRYAAIRYRPHRPPRRCLAWCAGLLNAPTHEINLAVEEFFADRRPDDLLLVHFSCHGVKDEDGDLYFATSNTMLRRLGATAVGADFVNGAWAAAGPGGSCSCSTAATRARSSGA